MTLEESTTRAVAAAETGDMEVLKQALGERRRAIAELNAEVPSEDLAARMRSALEAGAAIAQALFLHKQRIGFENARLARLAAGLAAGCGIDR